MATYDNTNLPIKQSHRAFDNSYFGAGGTGPTGPTGSAGTSAIKPSALALTQTFTTTTLTSASRVDAPFSTMTIGSGLFGGNTHLILNFKVEINNSLSTYSTTSRNNFFAKGTLIRVRDGLTICQSEAVDLRLMDDGNRAVSFFEVSAKEPLVFLTPGDSYNFCMTFFTDNGTARTASIVYKPECILQFV